MIVADFRVYFHSLDQRADSFQVSVAASGKMYVGDDVVFYFYFDIAAACALCSVIDLHIAKPKCDKKDIPDKAGHLYRNSSWPSHCRFIRNEMIMNIILLPLQVSCLYIQSEHRQTLPDVQPSCRLFHAVRELHPSSRLEYK